MTTKKEKLIRTTVQLRDSQHKALENLSGPGKSISHLVRTAVDIYLEPLCEQAYRDKDLDRMLEEAKDTIEKLQEDAYEMRDIFENLKSKSSA